MHGSPGPGSRLARFAPRALRLDPADRRRLEAQAERVLAAHPAWPWPLIEEAASTASVAPRSACRGVGLWRASGAPWAASDAAVIWGRRVGRLRSRLSALLGGRSGLPCRLGNGARPWFRRGPCRRGPYRRGADGLQARHGDAQEHAFAVLEHSTAVLNRM
jgi:hypothetical protein